MEIILATMVGIYQNCSHPYAQRHKETVRLQVTQRVLSGLSQRNDRTAALSTWLNSLTITFVYSYMEATTCVPVYPVFHCCRNACNQQTCICAQKPHHNPSKWTRKALSTIKQLLRYVILKKFLSVKNHSILDHTVFSVKAFRSLFFYFTTILLSHSGVQLGAMLHYILPLSQLKVTDEASQATVYTLKTLWRM